MKYVLGGCFRENQKKLFVFNDFFFFLENRVVYEIMSKNMVLPEGTQMTSQHGTYELNAG
jgi:hypothetical protein